MILNIYDIFSKVSWSSCKNIDLKWYLTTLSRKLSDSTVSLWLPVLIWAEHLIQCFMQIKVILPWILCSVSTGFRYLLPSVASLPIPPLVPSIFPVFISTFKNKTHCQCKFSVFANTCTGLSRDLITLSAVYVVTCIYLLLWEVDNYIMFVE